MTTTRMAMPKTITLHMETDDIVSGICNSRSQCAIARNLYRELGLTVGRVRVSTAGVSIAKDGHRYYYRVPTKACKLVASVDRGELVQPLLVYSLRFSNRTKISEIPTERKAQINQARALRNEALAAVGTKPRMYPKGR